MCRINSNAYKRLDNAVSVALGAYSVGSLVLTSSTLGSALTGIGVIATLISNYIGHHVTFTLKLYIINGRLIINESERGT